MGFAAVVRPAPARITRAAQAGNHRAEASRAAMKDTRTLAQFLSRNGQGHRDLWMLKALLDQTGQQNQTYSAKQVA